MDAVVSLGDDALDIPLLQEWVLLYSFESLKLFDHQEVELWGEPHAEVVGYVFVGVCASVASCFGKDADGSCLLHEFVDRDVEAVGAGLHSNPPEFGGFKIGVVDGLPEADVVDGGLVVEPLLDEFVAVFEGARHVGERQIVGIPGVEKDGYLCFVDGYL